MQSNNTPFPARGDNFDTLAILDDGQISLDALEALSFVHDCQIALNHFQKTEESEKTVQVQTND